MEHRAGVNGFLFIATKLEGRDGQVRPSGLILETLDSYCLPRTGQNQPCQIVGSRGYPLAPGTLFS